MKRIVLCERTTIPPFGEPARDLRILNKPLWLLQRDLLASYCRGALEVDSLEEIPAGDEELIVYRDNLFFNEHLVAEFLTRARATGRACRIAFAPNDLSISTYAIRLQDGIRMDETHGVLVADMYYFPHGVVADPQPLLIDTLPREMGYYHIPKYMARHGDLVFHVPYRAFLSIESWIHVFLANTPFGVFSWGRIQEERADKSWKEKLTVVFSALADKLNPFAPAWRNHFFSSSHMVKVGKNCSIDPSAVIHGPTVIGNNVTIGAGVVITNSLIGDNVTIMQGSQVMLSVVSDRCYLPWNSGLFMTTFMDNTMVAQLTCLQMCVVGRNTFIGAGNIFTDFDLLNKPIHTYHKGRLQEVGMPVLGSAVGHNCKMGSGFVIYPGRMIGSGSVLIYTDPESVIVRNVDPQLPEGDEALDDDGEPRRAIYRWPHRQDEGAEHDHDLGDDDSDHSQNGASRIDPLRTTAPKLVQLRY